MSRAHVVCPTCGHAVGELDARFCPNDGTPLAGGEAWRDPLVGAVIDGRYRILLRIGEGGFATVYHARHERLGIDAAVKVLRPELAGDPRVVARFAREARTTSRIDHPNVVRVLDFGSGAATLHYFATEFVPGTPLSVELAKVGALPPLRVAHITAQVVAGVGRAHALGIVHRDLKPENVMLVRHGADRDFVKVLDFGIAAVANADKVTSPGDVLGTAHYMAPEQWHGQADTRSDVYAIGAMVFEMLTGQPPFDGTALQLLGQHMNVRAPRPTERVPALRAGAAFDELVDRCMAKRPEDRVQTTDELLAMLGRMWAQLGRPSGRVTYSSTAAAPGAGTDSLPDATVYESSPIDVVWDGATLCEEIRRLHLLRAHRLAELATVLWGERWPDDARTARERAEVVEDAIEHTGEEIALLEARVEEQWRRGREEEARLRLAVIDANLVAGAALSRLPASALTDAGIVLPEHGEVFVAAETIPGRDAPTPTERLRSADLKLAAHHRKMQHDEQSIRERIATRVAELATLERTITPDYEQLAAITRRAVARRPELRPAMLAFAQVDGALAAYQGLLAALEAEGGV